jgi:hypothetical protein
MVTVTILGSALAVRLEHSDGEVEGFLFHRGHPCEHLVGDAIEPKAARVAMVSRAGPGAITGFPSVTGLHPVGPSFALVEVTRVGGFTTSLTYSLVGRGREIELGATDSVGHSSRGWVPRRLQEAIAADVGMTRLLISGQGQRLCVLHLDELKIVALGTGARPAHKIALAEDRPLAATCESGQVRVWSTESGEELACVETAEGRPAEPRFSEDGERLTWRGSSEPWIWRS